MVCEADHATTLVLASYATVLVLERQGFEVWYLLLGHAPAFKTFKSFKIELEIQHTAHTMMACNDPDLEGFESNLRAII